MNTATESIGASTATSAPASSSPILSEIERLQSELHSKMAELERQKEALAASEIERKKVLIEKLRVDLGAATIDELILMIRNQGVKSDKAKRLPDTTLKQMKWALANGATAPDVAKHFRVSLATVHSRKSQWKLTHRKGVKVKPVKDSLKDFKA